jgi:amidase
VSGPVVDVTEIAPGSDATGQAELVRRREVSARELVEAAVDAAERVAPAINALVATRFERAVAEASNAPPGPLAGVPIVIKDFLAHCEGMAHTEGSRFLARHVAARDSALVARLRAAGAIVVAATNTPEFALLSTCEPVLHGPTRNPWDVTRSTGGSSGGSAAAVAAGIVAVGHGSDAGGSLRIPASCCGLVGLKPSRGRRTIGDPGDRGWWLWAEHVITRTVRDSALVLDVLAGAPSGTGRAGASSGSRLEALDVPPRPLRVAVTTGAPNGSAVSPACAAAAERTAAACEALGHAVVEAAPAFDVALAEREFFLLFAEGLAARIDGWARRLGRAPGPGELERVTRALETVGRSRTGADHLQGTRRLESEGRRILELFDTVDVWVTPTLAQPPAPLGAFDPRPGVDPLEILERDAAYSPFTWLANVTGQPAISLPVHASAGLPIGAHLVARPGEDELLLRLSRQLERSALWSDCRPPAAGALVAPQPEDVRAIA